MLKCINCLKNKFILLMSVWLLICSCIFTGCKPEHGRASYDSSENSSGNDKSDKRLNVVTTLFPYYDFLRQIAGDSIKLTMVVPAGMDSHSFEPTPADIITIQNADVLVCNGGTMEQWLSKVLDSFEEGVGPGRVVTMMDYVDVVEEEIVEGMEDGESHDHEHEHAHVHGDGTTHEDDHEHVDEDHVHSEEEHGTENEKIHDDDHNHEDIHDNDDHNHEDLQDDDGSDHDDHDEEIEYDEHIWTSPVNAKKLVGVLSDVLSEEDSLNADIYAHNCSEYQEKLSGLDKEFRNIVSHTKRRLVVFGDKFPLRYFFDEYGLEYRAAFSGCSTDTEPSAKTIAYLIDRVREERIPAVYYLELSSSRVAEIIGEETGAEPLLFHSCHNVTRRQFDSGITYLELMEQNAVNLKKGLS